MGLVCINDFLDGEKKDKMWRFLGEKILERFWAGNLKNSEDENIKRNFVKKNKIRQKRKSWKFYSCSTRKYFEILDYNFVLTIAKDKTILLWTIKAYDHLSNDEKKISRIRQKTFSWSHSTCEIAWVKLTLKSQPTHFHRHNVGSVFSTMDS